VKGTLNSNTCPAGSARIATEAACQTAASAMGLGYGSSGSYSNYPKGCYQWSDGAVYFNQHATGGADAQSQLLCSGSPVAGTLPAGPAPVSGCVCCTLARLLLRLERPCARRRHHSADNAPADELG
jgi:hypothetical protein